jgi:hypothetical protein
MCDFQRDITEQPETTPTAKAQTTKAQTANDVVPSNEKVVNSNDIEEGAVESNDVGLHATTQLFMFVGLLFYFY